MWIPIDAKMLEVHWVDSRGDCGGWLTEKEAEEACSPCRIVTVGYLFHEDEESMTLASSVDKSQSQHFRGLMTIPKRAIINSHVLQPDT